MDSRTLAWLDQEHAHTAAVIRKFGWFIAYVWDCQGVDPPFAYTTGLFGLAHPELLIFGVPSRLAALTINQLGERIRCGEELMPGQPVRVDGWSACIVPEVVPNPAQILLIADRYYGRSVPALQLSYDDRQGTFPWQDGYVAPPMQPRPGTFSAVCLDERDDFGSHRHDTVAQPSTDHLPPWMG
jgi:uncharacterized protein DUF4262